MKSIELPAKEFDLAMTLNSGQVFHWEKAGDGFCGAIGERAVYVRQRSATLHVAMEGGSLRRCGGQGEEMPRATTPKTFASTVQAATAGLVRHYFALDHPLDEDLYIVPTRLGYERGAQLLPGSSNNPSAEMGMPGHLHLLVDEAGRAYPEFREHCVNDLARRKKFAATRFFRFRRLTDWRVRPRTSCENAAWVIALRICWQRRNASPWER